MDSIPMLADDQPVASSSSPPRVSVVMPVYNVAPYLERALESALCQSMPDLEVLVVDDGSTDATASIAERIASRDQRVRLLRNDGNHGEPYTRMRAHAAACGEWLAPLDGDDAWLPDRLERMLSERGADQADAISDDLYRVEPDGKTAWRCLQHRWQDPLIVDTPRWLDARDMVRHHLGVVQPLMRRSFLERHNLGVPNARLANDFYLYLEMLLAGARWLHVPGAYYIYYTTSGSVTASWSRYGAELLENHVRYAECSLVRALPGLRAELLQFVKDERASLLVEQLRSDVKQHHFRRAASRLLAQPTLLPRATRQTVRLWRVKRRRRQTALHVRADGVRAGYSRNPQR